MRVAAVVAPLCWPSSPASRAPAQPRSTALLSPPHPAAPSRVPGQVLDLSNWYLTLPTGTPGKPDTVLQPALATYSSPFFQVDPGRGGVVFTSDAGGVTTENSGYPRSELREMNGPEKAKWSNRSGSHTLEVRQSVIALPPVKPECRHGPDPQRGTTTSSRSGSRTTPPIARYGGGGATETRTATTIIPPNVLGTPYDLASSPPPDGSTSRQRCARWSGCPRGRRLYFRPAAISSSVNVSKGDAATRSARSR